MIRQVYYYPFQGLFIIWFPFPQGYSFAPTLG